MSAASSITEKLINNILEWATELKHSAREFVKLPSSDQAQVWNDLTGDEGRRRQFGIDGKEISQSHFMNQMIWWRRRSRISMTRL